VYSNVRMIFEGVEGAKCVRMLFEGVEGA
jgi:hypothetical protein